MKLSIIIPTLNEAAIIEAALGRLQGVRSARGEVIVVDGGSDDDTMVLSARYADHVISAPRARARQMNAGAALASGEALLFLHADTRLPQDAIGLIESAFAGQRYAWGSFALVLSGHHPAFRVIETLINLRSRMSGIVTGDKALFVRRAAFMAVGGYPDIPLMEDIALSKRLKAHCGRPIHIPRHVLVSSRYWETRGILRAVITLWALRLAYFLGVAPAVLVKIYYREK